MNEVIDAPARAVATPTAGPAATSPMGMMLAALSQGATLEQVEKMMDLQERWEANEARKAFVQAMTAFKAEPIVILKRKRVGFDTKDGGNTSYNHAELSDVTEAISPTMAKHELSYRWDVRQGDGRVTVDCVITHVRGHSETVTMSGAPDTSGKKNAIQQAASTVTYLQRYTLLAATGMSTKGADDDGVGAGEYRNALLDEWAEKLQTAKSEQDLRALSREGQKIFNSKRDQVGFRDFSTLVQARAAEIQGVQHA